jgi:hypothetical protein
VRSAGWFRGRPHRALDRLRLVAEFRLPRRICTPDSTPPCFGDCGRYVPPDLITAVVSALETSGYKATTVMSAETFARLGCVL